MFEPKNEREEAIAAKRRMREDAATEKRPNRITKNKTGSLLSLIVENITNLKICIT